MDEAVNHGVGLDAAAEAAVPLGRGVLGAQHRRLRRAAPLDQPAALGLIGLEQTTLLKGDS